MQELRAIIDADLSRKDAQEFLYELEGKGKTENHDISEQAH
jgi:hypothetical protein